MTTAEAEGDCSPGNAQCIGRHTLRLKAPRLIFLSLVISPGAQITSQLGARPLTRTSDPDGGVIYCRPRCGILSGRNG